ncbi:right-handed parallel beta-helix repeat-containing protein [Aliihoeflea sp. PC F10.4]
MPQTAETIFRDFTTDGIPASGKHEPLKVEIREWGANLEGYLSAGAASASVLFTSLASLSATLTHPAATMAWVIGDPVAANNGVYQKLGALGSGSWVKRADLPYSSVRASDVGAGTPNAIQATTSTPVPTADGGALVALNIFRENTGSPVTVAFNGGQALTVKTASGNDVIAGGLPAGMLVAGYRIGSTFRLISDQASAGIIAAVEALAADAAASAQAALDALSSVELTEFVTKAVAEDRTPETAPAFVRTAFYDSTYLNSSGDLYAPTGTSDGPITITLADGETVVGYKPVGPTISAASFGLKSGMSALAAKACLRLAASFLAAGMTLLVPNLGAMAEVDTTGGLTAAIHIDKPNTRVQIDGHLKSNYAANEPNPSFMFRVTAHNVEFCGTGALEGNGFDNVTSAGGSSAIYPGLVYVLGTHNFKYRDLRMIKPPKIGVYIVNSFNGTFDTAVFEGGTPTFEFSTLPDGSPNPNYVGSYLCAITTSGGAGHTFHNLRFIAGADGGRVTQGIFNGGNSGVTNRCVVSSCYADRPWEKLWYGYGDYHRIFGNYTQGPTLTDAIRVWGSFCEVFGNITDGCAAGVQCLDGRGNKIFGNNFLRCGSTGINVQHFSASYALGISLNEVRGNHITWDGVSTGRRFGIRVLANDAVDVSLCAVEDNLVQGFGFNDSYAIEVTAPTPRIGYANTVKNNRLISCGDAIRVSRNVGGYVEDNKFRACTGRLIRLEGGSGCVIESNKGDGGLWFMSVVPGSGHTFRNNKGSGFTNIGIEGFVFGQNNNYAEGNQFTAAPLLVPVTLTAAATNTITHGGIASHATIDLIPISATFATRNAAVGYYTSPNGNDFNIAAANGSANAGGEACRARIIQ